MSDSEDGIVQYPPAPLEKRREKSALEWVRDIVASLAISAFVIVFVYQPVKVEGTSMMPGLSDQERIFINKFVYRWEPVSRGDVVVFHYPYDPAKSYIKRVVGIAGRPGRDPAGLGLCQWRVAVRAICCEADIGTNALIRRG